MRAPENRVKYGVRCEGANAWSRGTLCFTVFAALYVETCSENPVKYGARGAFTVSSATVAWVFTLFCSCLLEVETD